MEREQESGRPMSSYLHREAQDYRILRERLLEQMPELANDPDCLLDTLDGATNVKEQLAALIRSALQDEALVDGLHEYEAKLADRKCSLKARALRKRRIALSYMSELNLKNITAPDLTVTRKAVPPLVLITTEADIPDQFMRIKREPDKTAIRQALTNGESVPGCTMSNGSETLQVKI
jgi:hypothetical protein